MAIKHKPYNTTILELDFQPHKAPLLALKAICPSYSLVYYINTLYNIQLYRHNDLKLNYNEKKTSQMDSADPVLCPFFSYFDELSHILYLLIRVKDLYYSQNIFNTYIFFIGPNAATFRNQMYDDLTASPSKQDICDSEALCKDPYLNEQLHHAIFMSAFFDFPENKEPRTSYFSVDIDPKVNKNRSEYLDRLKKFANIVLATAENNFTGISKLEDTTIDYEESNNDNITLIHKP